MDWHQNMSGRWVGVYVKYGADHPLTAELRQEGSRLRGEMADGDLAFDVPLSLAVAGTAWAGWSLKGIERAIRWKHRDMPEGEIYCLAELPASSTLSGRVAGSRVRFRKVYEGQSVIGLRVGEWTRRAVHQPMPVQYRGKLSDDERTLTGTWSIRRPDPLGRLVRPLASGAFRLEKT